MPARPVCGVPRSRPNSFYRIVSWLTHRSVAGGGVLKAGPGQDDWACGWGIRHCVQPAGEEQRRRPTGQGVGLTLHTGSAATTPARRHQVMRRDISHADWTGAQEWSQQWR
jgi:hypothetical protein